MSSPTPSDISQNDTEILEMQQKYKEEQHFLVQLKEAVKLHWAKCMAQKARREAEEKAWEKAERKRVVEEEEGKRRTMEYLQWLWNEMLEEEATLLERAKESQIIGSKCKKITTRDEEEQQLSKKTKEKQQGKYHSGATIKIGGANPCERCVSTGQNCLVHFSR